MGSKFGILLWLACVISLIDGEKFITKSSGVMALFGRTVRPPGPCQYGKQNRICRRNPHLIDALKEASELATRHCEQQFQYDRWNCSVETRGKRNIFKKLYRETAFVHAITAAAVTHTVSRACAEGRLRKCSCGAGKQYTKPGQAPMAWQWGGCNDNIRYGKRITRVFLELNPTDGDQVSELLRHDSEVGIQTVTNTMRNKCKCHGVSGSCSMKTCWRKLSDFNTTTAELRIKYHQAIRKKPSNRASRREATHEKKNHQKKVSLYTTLLYMETSPTFCSVTKGRRCLHPHNCATLCCNRGYNTRIHRYIEKCRCRFKDGRCCQVVCDLCKRFEDRYFCK